MEFSLDRLLKHLKSRRSANRRAPTKSRRQMGVEHLETRRLLAADTGAVDDLIGLSDDFDNSETIAVWQRVNEVEGWNADQLQVWDVDQTQSGRMVMQPHTVVWFEDWRGPMVFKEVSGDFVFTSQVVLSDRDDIGNADADDVPNDAAFSLGGIMIRTPRPIENPVVDWAPGSRQDDGTSNGENYVFLSMGHGTDGQFSFEVKTTRNSRSQLELTPLGQDANMATLRIAKIGDSIITLYQLPGEDWTIHRRYSRPDMPDTMQLGLVTYSNWNKASDFDPLTHNSTILQAGVNDPTPSEPFNPDLVAGFEYANFARPMVPSELSSIDLVTQASNEQLLRFLGEVESSHTNRPPELTAIADQSLVLGEGPLILDLEASDPDADALSFDVQIVGGTMADLVAQHGLHEMSWRDDFALNWGGENEKWLQGEEGWYFLLPDGTLNHWDGSFAASEQLATLTIAEYDNPHRLLSATNPDLDAEVVGQQLFLTAGQQVGGYDVEITVSDGTAIDRTTFRVETTNTVPFVALNDQSSFAGTRLTLELPTVDADGHLLIYTIETIGDELGTLDDQHGFWADDQYYTNYLGQNEKWIRDATNHWHYIDPSGALYRWEGSFVDSQLLAQLPTNVYQTPALLTDPEPIPIVATIEGNVLTIISSAEYRGTVLFELTASDGYAQSTTTFQVALFEDEED